MSTLEETTGSIVSIGYEGRTIDEFVRDLKATDVSVLFDVRLTPISRKPGFSKTKLAAALSAADIEYRHLRALGNPKSNRDAFRDGLPAARETYLQLLHETSADGLDHVVLAARHEAVALLCFERDHATCHRSCITDQAQRAIPALTVLKI